MQNMKTLFIGPYLEGTGWGRASLCTLAAMDYLTRLQAYAKRNRQIKKLRDQGWPQVRIAKHFGMTRQRVQQVLSK